MALFTLPFEQQVTHVAFGAATQDRDVIAVLLQNGDIQLFQSTVVGKSLEKPTHLTTIR